MVFSLLTELGGLGQIGVNLFFFISGILVYRSLKKEQAKSSWQLAISFWWRRLRRLYPALIAYVIAMLIPVAILQRLPNLPSQSSLASYIHTLPFALTYSINYLNEGAAAMALVHLWSLSCEMQFYLVAPGIFILAGRDRRRQMLVFGGVALALGAVGLIYPMRGSQYLAIKYRFEIAAWPMALGVFCEFAKVMVPCNFARCGQVHICIRGDGPYGCRHRYAVWDGSEETCHRHRRNAAFSMLVELFVWGDRPGSNWALARVVRSKNLFDLSMPTTVYALQVPCPDAGTFGGRSLHHCWGGVVSHIRIAGPESEPDGSFS